MRLIKSSCEIIPQDDTLDGIYKHIELCGRVAYKSEDKITEDSARKFVEKLIAMKHLSPLEHGTIYLHIPIKSDTRHKIDSYICNKYSICKINKDLKSYCISTNYRVLIEHNWLDDLQYQCKPTEFHEKRITVRLILDRAIAMEFLRHRKFCFTMESSRFCDYSRNRFGNEITCIKPSWMRDCVSDKSYDGALSILAKTPIDNYQDEENTFLLSLCDSEKTYFALLNKGWKPQQARAVLPNALKTELIMTGYVTDWRYFFSLRAPLCGAKGVHPDAAYLADELYLKLKENL